MDNEAMISTAQHSAAQLHSIKFSVKVCCLVLLLSGIYTSEICASEPKDAVPDVSQQSSSQTVSAETQQATPQTTSEPERLWKNSTWVLTPAQSLPDKPLISHDPLAWLYVNDSNSKAWYQRLQLDVISYTAVDDYTTDEISATPTEKPRHNQGYGRLDFNAHWNVYQSGSTAGSIHILVRSGESLGLPQSYNINTAIGSGISPMCLQNKTVSVNVLYWEQDFLNKKLQFHIGHIHPNQYVNLSYLGDDETFEFMASPYDGNASNPYVGSYSTGAAVLYQATPHIYVHAVATDTEESAYDGPRTLQDGNMAESYEVGWFSGEYGHNLRSYRLTGWHEDTKTNGAGYGGSLEFDHELASGWAPFGKLAIGTREGNATKQAETIGLANTHPFGRRDDMFGIAGMWDRNSAISASHRQEQSFETFYRARITHSMELGPDIQMVGHPENNPKVDHTVMVGARMRIIF